MEAMVWRPWYGGHGTEVMVWLVEERDENTSEHKITNQSAV